MFVRSSLVSPKGIPSGEGRREAQGWWFKFSAGAHRDAPFLIGWVRTLASICSP